MSPTQNFYTKSKPQSYVQLSNTLSFSFSPSLKLDTDKALPRGTMRYPFSPVTAKRRTLHVISLLRSSYVSASPSSVSLRLQTSIPFISALLSPVSTHTLSLYLLYSYGFILSLDMEGPSKSPESDVTAANLRTLLEEADLDSDLPPEFPIKEETIEEVMQELYKEISCPAPTSANANSPPGDAPPPSLPSPLVPPQLWVDCGKQGGESCGASLSDSSSTVMAGVEFAGMGLDIGGGEIGWGWAEEEEEEGGGVGLGEEWLEKVMGWGPVDLEGWT